MMMEKIILFINRDSIFREQTRAFLEKAGYTVRCAEEMRDALSVLSSSSVGLIICDKSLHDLSGLDFLNFIKKDPLRESIPFMFLVSAKAQGGAFNAFELGAVDYFVYPIEPEALLDRIDDVFSSTGLRRSGTSRHAGSHDHSQPDNRCIQGWDYLASRQDRQFRPPAHVPRYFIVR